VKEDISHLLPYADSMVRVIKPLAPVDQMKLVELLTAKLALIAEANFTKKSGYEHGSAEFVLDAMRKHAGQIVAFYKKNQGGKIMMSDLETEKIQKILP
jgi:hypothetical protein